MNEATVIAYPVDSPNNRSHSNNSHLSHNSLMEENIYASSLGDSKFADDTIEMSGNFFSQVKLSSVITRIHISPPQRTATIHISHYSHSSRSWTP